MKAAFAPREVLAGKDARTVAREILTRSQQEFGPAFKGSPMKGAKLRELKRNAAVVLGDVGTHDDIDVLSTVGSLAIPRVRSRLTASPVPS